MTPNHYMTSWCFTEHPLKDCCLGYHAKIGFVRGQEVFSINIDVVALSSPSPSPGFTEFVRVTNCFFFCTNSGGLKTPDGQFTEQVTNFESSFREGR